VDADDKPARRFTRNATVTAVLDGFSAISAQAKDSTAISSKPSKPRRVSDKSEFSFLNVNLIAHRSRLLIFTAPASAGDVEQCRR
jgi:hypothetical protein